MSELHSLQLAIDVVARQRDTLAQAHGRAQQATLAAHTQLQQLESYAGDTDARWLRPDAQHCSAEMVRHHYQFMGRLQEAITMQRGVIDQLKKEQERAHHTLMQAEIRLAGLEHVVAARRAAQQRKQALREQKQTDEFASNLYARKRFMRAQGHTP